MDVTLKEGDKLTAAFAADGGRPWCAGARHTNLGQMNFTTWFSGWADATVKRVLLPLAYETRLGWRNVDFKMYVDGYQMDGEIEDLAAPAWPAPRPTAVERGADARFTIDRKRRVARGSGRHNGGRVPGPHVLFELGANVATAKAVIEYARTLAPGKPVRTWWRPIITLITPPASDRRWPKA